MQCCAECFRDRVLRKAIRDLSTHTGKCPYCDSDNEPLLEPVALRYYFEILISAYRPDPSGKLLAPLLREKWGIFRHPRMDDFRAKDLLAAILDDHDIVRQHFSPAPHTGPDWLGSWQKLRDELMYQNRFFPDVDIDLTFFEEILNGLVLEAYEVPAMWFRARIQNQDTPFSLDQMGAPPKRSASHGRANPAGIPYLYLGSKALTAISEIRPHTGEFIKRCGYDGVVYRSSVSDGINLALFDPARAVCGSTVTPHKVTRVSVEAAP